MHNKDDLIKEVLDLPKKIPGLNQEDSARMLVIVHKLLEGFNCDEDPKVCLEKMKSSINYGIKVSDSIDHENIGNVKENLSNFHKVITQETIAQDEEAVKQALGATVASIIVMVKDLGHDVNFTKFAGDITTGNIISVIDDLNHINFLQLAKDLDNAVSFGELTASRIAKLLEDGGERFSNFFNTEIKPTFKSMGVKFGHNEGFENFMHKLQHAFHHKKSHHDDEYNSATNAPPAEHTVLVEEHSSISVEVH